MTFPANDPAKRAFTLVEILLVIALVGVMVALVAGNAGAFIEGSKQMPPGRVLKLAVVDALYLAGERKRVTFLGYVEEDAAFVVTDASGGVLSKHPIFETRKEEENEVDEDESPKVTFWAKGPLAGAGGGSSIHDDDVLVVKRVPFHFGSSAPFRVEIETEDMRDPESYEFDPFSGYHLEKLGQEE